MIKKILDGFSNNIINFCTHNFNYHGDSDLICPGAFGLNECNITECNDENCQICWENAIKQYIELAGKMGKEVFK